MSKLSELCERAAAEVKPEKSEDAGIDPVTIALLIEVVVKIVLYVYDCWKNNQADSLKKVRKPGVFQRLVLHRVVRKVLKKYGASGQAKAVYDAILKMGEMISAEDFATVLAEVGKDMTVPRLAAEYGEA